MSGMKKHFSISELNYFPFIQNLFTTKKSHIVFFLIIASVQLLYAQEYTVKGSVYDKETSEPLSFVNIIINESQKGGISDIEGRFSLTSDEKPVYLKLSYVGYETYTYTIPDIKKHCHIFLKRSEIMLDEVVIVPGENPAHRIIDSVLQNRDKNNPEMQQSFSYMSHNKVSFGIDTEQIKSITPKDSADQEEIANLMNKTYLMLIESISERKYIFPKQNKETVIASKVSGFNDPFFSLIASQLQLFSFYTEYISIMDKIFLSPISTASTERYLFILEDTLFKENDTIFIISYRPRRNRNFDGLNGLLYINTNGWAIQNVTAEPSDGSIGSYQIKLRQSYSKIDGTHWFPVQLNTELLYSYPQSTLKIFANGRTYIKDIQINNKIPRKEIGAIEYEILDEAGERDEAFWDKYRFEPLTEKDIETYRFIDSISKANKLERFSGVIKTLIEGKIPYKIFNIDINHLFGFSNYQGWQLGIGLETNDKVSRLFSLGGYTSYSFKNDQLRYGANAAIHIDKRTDTKLTYSYINDDMESAATSNYDLMPSFKLNDFRSYLIRKTDYTQSHKLSLATRVFPYIYSKLSVSQSYIVPNFDYQYVRTQNNINILQDEFFFTEISLNSRLAYREKFIQSKDYRYSLGTPYPVFYIGISKGVEGGKMGDFDYFRLDMSIEKSIPIKLTGTSSLKIDAGITDSELPYCKLYNGKGSYENFSLFAPYSFNTMRMNEFLSDKYLAVFYQHSFGTLLFKTKRLKPEIVIVTNYGIGTYNKSSLHRMLEFKTMDKGYFESGLVINDLLHTGFYGLGTAVFYRYGYYAMPELKDNFVWKLSFKFNL